MTATDATDAELLARGHDIRRADVIVRGVACGDYVVDLVRADELRRDLDVRRAVLQLGVGRDVLAAQQSDRDLDSGVGLVLDRLVDRGRLPAEQDVLQARDVRVLTRHGNTREVVVLQDLDDTRCVRVVGDPHAVDLAAERGQRLLEVGLRLGLVPGSRGLGRRR